jgi:hypothetical protein
LVAFAYMGRVMNVFTFIDQGMYKGRKTKALF